MDISDIGSLDDIFDLLMTGGIDSGEYAYLLEAYLDDMPPNRASVEEILSAADLYDEYELYRKLFGDLKDFLTEAEKQALTDKYNETFDMPLFE